MTNKAKYIERCVDKYDRDSVDYFFKMLEEL